MTGVRGGIIQDLISAPLRDRLDALERQYEQVRGPDKARGDIIRLTASLLGNTELIVKSCILFWGALEKAEVNYVKLFARGMSTPAEIRRAFQADNAPRQLSPFIAVEQDRLVFGEGALQPPFYLSFEYLPFLVQFSALIVNLVEFKAIETAAERAADVPTKAGMEKVVSGFTKKWRSVAKSMMPKEQVLTKFNAIIQSLEKRLGENFTRTDVDDGAVIAVWDDFLFKEVSIGLTRYSSCVSGITLLLECWSRGEARFAEKREADMSFDIIDHSASPPLSEYGSDERAFEAAFPDAALAVIHDVFEANDEESIKELISAFRGSLFNALTNMEQEILLDLLCYPQSASRLHISRLRSYAFDWGQGRLSAATGKRSNGADIQEKLTKLSKLDYERTEEKLDKAYNSLRSGLLAIGHILLHHDLQAGLELLVGLSASRDVADLDLDEGRDDDQASAFRAAIARGELPGFILPLAEQAREEYARLSGSRGGFESDRLVEVEVYQNAASIAEVYSDQLTKLQSRANSFRSAIAEASYQKDALIIKDRLERKYIAGSGETA